MTAEEEEEEEEEAVTLLAVRRGGEAVSGCLRVCAREPEGRQ